jgi:hypothetical protein
VAGDPQNEKFKVPALGVGQIVPEGEYDGGKFKVFQVFADISAVFKRITEVASMKNE